MATTAERMEREQKLEGIGCSRKRKEDPGFIQGKGNYVEDVTLAGTLFAVVVRSPYAHARIKSINKAKALAPPGVHAVLTAEDLKPLKLHWMPTLAGDVQAVLADENVCSQYQEAAVVIAADPLYRRRRRRPGGGGRRAAAGSWSIRTRPWTLTCRIIREDLVGKDEAGQGVCIHNDYISYMEVVIRRVRQGYSPGRRGHRQEANLRIRASIPSDLRPAGRSCSFEKARVILPSTLLLQALYIVRTVVSLLSGLPESKIRPHPPGHRRRFRQQGGRLSGICHGHRRLHRTWSGR